METKNDGGAAFPELRALYKETAFKHTAVNTSGMTLRDYFAAKAMAAILAEADWQSSHCTMEAMSKDAYEMADTMISERAK